MTTAVDTHAIQQIVSPLTDHERADLAMLTARIERGREHLARTGLEIGRDLGEVQRRELYREDHGTFEKYCQAVLGHSRQYGYRLIAAANTDGVFSGIGLDLDLSVPEAAKLNGAAKTVSDLPVQDQQLVAQAIKAITSSGKPTTSQVRAFVETVVELNHSSAVQHPETGQPVPWTELPEAARAATLAENVSTGTNERMQRQQIHIQEKVLEANQTGRGGWQDWCMSYAQQNLTDSQELRITVKRDPSGNSKATALIVDTETHATVAFGDAAGWLKKAVMNLVEEVKGA